MTVLRPPKEILGVGYTMVLAGRPYAVGCVGLLPPPYAHSCRYPLRSPLNLIIQYFSYFSVFLSYPRSVLSYLSYISVISQL